LIRTLRNFSRKAKPSPAPAAVPEFQVQSLANHEEQWEIMTRVETIRVVGSVARAAISVLAVGATSEARA